MFIFVNDSALTLIGHSNGIAEKFKKKIKDFKEMTFSVSTAFYIKNYCMQKV